jgi:hypothetical protein
MQLRTATSRFTFPIEHRPKNLSIRQRDIHLVEIKYCEDTRPWNQLSAALEQHKSSRSLGYPPNHLFGSRWRHLQNHTLEPFKEVGLGSQRAKKLASCTFCQLRCQNCAHQMRTFQY